MENSKQKRFGKKSFFFVFVPLNSLFKNFKCSIYGWLLVQSNVKQTHPVHYKLHPSPPSPMIGAATAADRDFSAASDPLIHFLNPTLQGYSIPSHNPSPLRTLIYLRQTDFFNGLSSYQTIRLYFISWCQQIASPLPSPLFQWRGRLTLVLRN